jgi:transposase
MNGDDVVHQRAAGVDISKSDAKVCVRAVPPGRSRAVTQTEVFGSTMAEIRRLRAWLVECRVTCAVMESTSAYWKPFWDGLCGAGFELVLANAQAVKQLRGRKTDMSDAAWLAKLAASGMAPASFVPPVGVRDLRLATRTRARLTNRVTSATASLEKLSGGHRARNCPWRRRSS